MKDFQRILEECLTRLSNGTATVDECLARYPEHAAQLQPLLRTALRLNRGREVMPSPTFNAYTRSAVIQYIRSHPRQPRNIMPVFQRSALAFAMLVIALLATGTAQAQSALPGGALYSWKLTSEHVWRAFTLAPVETDLILAERRLSEWIAVSDDPTLSTSAMNNYLDAISKFKSVGDVETLTLITPVLQSQQQILNNAGLSNPELDNYLSDVASSVPAAVAATQVLPTSTHISPTDIPPIATNIPSTAIDVPPTVTDVPPTVTDVPPTVTDVPPTVTDVPPTVTDVPPTVTDVPPTVTDVPPIDTAIPPTEIPESTPTDEPLP